MNENKENYMGIFDNEKQDVSHINNEVKKEEKKEEINKSDLLPMYSDRLEESEKLFDPLGNHPLPNGVEKVEEEVVEEKKEKKEVEEIKKIESTIEDNDDIALSALDLEKASKSMNVDIIGNKELDKTSMILFIITIVSILLHSILTYNEYLKGLDTISISFIVSIYLFMLIVLILSKKKRKSASIFSIILVILLGVSIIKLNILTSLIGVLILIPTILYIKALKK